MPRIETSTPVRPSLRRGRVPSGDVSAGGQGAGTEQRRAGQAGRPARNSRRVEGSDMRTSDFPAAGPRHDCKSRKVVARHPRRCLEGQNPFAAPQQVPGSSAELDEARDDILRDDHAEARQTAEGGQGPALAKRAEKGEPRRVRAGAPETGDRHRRPGRRERPRRRGP